MKSIIELCEQNGDILLYDSTKDTYAKFFKYLFLKSGLKNIKWQQRYIPRIKRTMRVVDLAHIYKDIFDVQDYPSVSEVRDLLLKIYLCKDMIPDHIFTNSIIPTIYPYVFLLYTKDLEQLPTWDVKYEDVRSSIDLHKYLCKVDHKYLSFSIGLKHKSVPVKDMIHIVESMVEKKAIDKKSSTYTRLLDAIRSCGWMQFDQEDTIAICGKEEFVKYLHSIGIATIPTRYGYTKTDGTFVMGAN